MPAPIYRAATWPLHEAIALAIEADAVLGALLAGNRVYNLQAPADAELPYVVIGDTGESEWSGFQCLGAEAPVTLHIWAEAPRNDLVLRIWAELAALFHWRALAVVGFRLCVGPCSLVGSTLDADGRTVHGVVRYAPRLRQT